MNQQASHDGTRTECGAIGLRLLWVGFVLAATGCAGWQPSRTAYRPPAMPIASGNSARAGSRAAGAPAATRPARTVRGQDRAMRAAFDGQDPGSDQFLRNRMPVTAAQYTPPATATPIPPAGTAPAPAYPTPAPGGVGPAFPYAAPGAGAAPGGLPAPEPLAAPGPQEVIPPPYGQPYVDIDPTMTTPLDVFVEETQTGRFMFGAGINSDAGVTGQIVIDERNFDITRIPTSFSDFINGTAFRGGGQGFRLEAMPGNLVQRYLISFTEPYLLNTRISLNVSGFLYDRRFFDWDERRAGGRLSLGYRLTPDLSFSAAIRGERVKITDPRVPVPPPELTAVLGRNELYSGRFTLTHDTRDVPFSPSEGQLIELSYEQVFGSFDYPRGELDYRRYFIIRERPDGSGRHTLGYIFRLGFSGPDTPLFENYFAGGFSTLRGFDYRGASPVDPITGVRLGGVFRCLGAAEYVFPLTADDMLKGALFVDFGTVEQSVKIRGDTFRVAPGFGLRINVPALGPAPLAFDFAFPVAKADTDEEQMFSFFMGVGR